MRTIKTSTEVLAEIRAFAKAQDDKMDDAANDGRNAVPPTGDDWNDLHSIVMQPIEQPAKFRDRTEYTALQMEAALCAWEDMCDRRDKPIFAQHFANFGSSAMRHVAMQAGAVALAVWDEMEWQGYEFADSYDWEFVPAVLNRIDWTAIIADNQYSGTPYTPDIAAIFADILSGNSSFIWHDREAAWMAKAKAECIKQWAYADLIVDHDERTAEALARKQDPAEFVKWLGEKYGLTPAREW